MRDAIAAIFFIRLLIPVLGVVPDVDIAVAMVVMNSCRRFRFFAPNTPG